MYSYCFTATESEIEYFLKYCKNNAKVIKDSKQLLMIERTICEYNLNDTKDLLIQDYFDLLKYSFHNYEMETSSITQINKLRTRIQQNVS